MLFTDSILPFWLISLFLFVFALDQLAKEKRKIRQYSGVSLGASSGVEMTSKRGRIDV
jgi:hypothetical protein